MSFDLVTIRVGESNDAVDIPVYRELISSVSPYFRSAFEGDFMEATERVIPLVDVTEQTFRVFLQWAHAHQHLSGSNVLVPDLSIIPSSISATSQEPNPVSDNEDNSEDICNDSSDIATKSSNKAFDEPGYQFPELSEGQRDSLYYKNKTWLKQYDMVTVSYLNLYIFAHRYSVDQLRDDIMTAMLGQSNSWEFFPDPTLDHLTTAYENLPISAMFQRWMILSTAYYWVPHSGEGLMTKLRSLHEWQPNFAFEVSLAHAQMLQVKRDRGDDLAYDHQEEIPNSCVFHEHVVRNQGECRDRIKHRANIFAELIIACAKDGVAMVKQEQEN
jgi:hypothetical protein